MLCLKINVSNYIFVTFSLIFINKQLHRAFFKKRGTFVWFSRDCANLFNPWEFQWWNTPSKTQYNFISLVVLMLCLWWSAKALLEWWALELSEPHWLNVPVLSNFQLRRKNGEVATRWIKLNLGLFINLPSNRFANLKAAVKSIMLC